MKNKLIYKTVDEYLNLQNDNNRTALEKLRKIIKSTVPSAEEVISYQIPVFKYNGMLVGFAAFKNHCSFFVMSITLMKTLYEELKTFSTAAATIHFTSAKPLPPSLVEKIVKERMKENELKKIKKLKKRK